MGFELVNFSCMSESKTKATKASVSAFLNAIQPEQKRKDALQLLVMFKKATGEKPVMWGTSIVGFGTYHYTSSRSAQKGEWMMTGFSPRKANLTLYIVAWTPDRKIKPVFKTLGKHKVGGGCLYINKLSDIDANVLAAMIKDAWARKKKFVGPKRSVIL